MKKEFDSFFEASEYAKQISKKQQLVMSVKRTSDGRFYVNDQSPENKVAHQATFDVCEYCCQLIPEARRKLLPDVRYCVVCQESLEARYPHMATRTLEVNGIGGSRQDAKRTLKNRHR